MTIDETISALQKIKEECGGDVDVKVWEYAGGNDELRDVLPVFDRDHQVVTVNTEN